MRSKRIQPWRRSVEILQGVVILGIPFIQIKGESAFRFDVPLLRLHLFGISLWMEEFFIILTFTIFLILLLLLFTLIFGRIWCGWLCPQTVLVNLTRYLGLDRYQGQAGSRGIGYKVVSYVATFAVSLLVAASLIWYFVSPYEFTPKVAHGNLGSVLWGFWITLTAVIFMNLAFLRHRFCATVCPYSMIQSALYDDNTLVISFDQNRQDECSKCKACVSCCPTGIDIREGLSSACINCAECIDACAGKMETQNRKSLIGYSFGLTGRGRKILRPPSVILASVAGFFLVLTIYLFMVRVTLAMSILPNNDFPPRLTREGKTVNSYFLSMQNRSRIELDFLLEAAVSSAEMTTEMAANAATEVAIIPSGPVKLKGGQMKRIPVYITITDAKENLPITISMVSRDEDIRISKTTIFSIAQGL